MLVHSFVKENHHLGIGKFYPLLVFRPGSPTTSGIQFVVGDLMQALK